MIHTAQGTPYFAGYILIDTRRCVSCHIRAVTAVAAVVPSSKICENVTPGRVPGRSRIWHGNQQKTRYLRYHLQGSYHTRRYRVSYAFRKLKTKAVRSRISSKHIFASCVMLTSRVLRVLYGLLQDIHFEYGAAETKSEAADFKDS